MRPTSRFWLVILFSLVLLPAQWSWGWIDAGHKIVALVAWEDLTPKTRAAISELLKKHPRYEKDLLADLPAGSTPEETDRYAFAAAATWPDTVRSQSNPMHTLFSHPSWHFIDIPVVEGVAVPTTAEAAPEPGPKNAIEALQQCAAELKNPKTTDDQKAIDICWLAHVVGDIHQPLHAATLYSQQFPKGDKGGNDEEVLRDPPYTNSRTNLHHLWDALPGEFQSEKLDRYEAMGLRSDPEYSREQLKSLLTKTDFMDWAKESHDLAEHVAYLDGHLQASVFKRGARGAGSDPTPGVPPGYIQKAEETAMHQVVLGGYRLADLLNAELDPKP